MRRFHVAFCILVFAVAVVATVAVPGRAEPREDRCVILISVDGLAGFYLDDPKAHMPTLRRLAKEGARADGLVCSFPTVTWPNHTTLVTGVPPSRHGVIGNNYLDRNSGEVVPLIVDPLFDKDQIVKVPTVYDVAFRAGLTTSAIIWPATRNARTLHWTVPDMRGNESWQRWGTASWLAELRELGLPIDRYGPWVSDRSGGVQRDWLYVRMADQLLRKHSPNLLLIHLVEVDHVQHRYGPRSGDAYWAVSYADDRIRDIVESVAASPKRDSTTIFVCSDHGFFPIERNIQPNVLLKQMGLIETEGNRATKKRAFCVAQGGGCAVYVLEKDAKRRAEILAELREKLPRIEGVDVVIGPEQFDTIGQPTPDEDPRGADLWLSARSGYAFSGSLSGDDIVVPLPTRQGTHGYLPDQPDMLGTCVIWGAGIRPGTRLGKVNSVDIAPTMARLLGIEMPNVDGKPLTKALLER